MAFKHATAPTLQFSSQGHFIQHITCMSWTEHATQKMTGEEKGNKVRKKKVYQARGKLADDLPEARLESQPVEAQKINHPPLQWFFKIFHVLPVPHVYAFLFSRRAPRSSNITDI
jgi:hypothetical protein